MLNQWRAGKGLPIRITVQVTGMEAPRRQMIIEIVRVRSEWRKCWKEICDMAKHKCSLKNISAGHHALEI